MMSCAVPHTLAVDERTKKMKHLFLLNHVSQMAWGLVLSSGYRFMFTEQI
jgi:hypothetical protein